MERSVISLAASRISAFSSVETGRINSLFLFNNPKRSFIAQTRRTASSNRSIEFHHVESVLLPYPCIRKKATTIYLPRLKNWQLALPNHFIPARKPAIVIASDTTTPLKCISFSITRTIAHEIKLPEADNHLSFLSDRR